MGRRGGRRTDRRRVRQSDGVRGVAFVGDGKSANDLFRPTHVYRLVLSLAPSGQRSERVPDARRPQEGVLPQRARD